MTDRSSSISSALAPETELAHLHERLTEETRARMQAEEARRYNEDDARYVLENIPQLVWRSRSDGAWTWGSPQWTAYTGQSDLRSQGHGWLDAVHPDDRGKTVRAWDAASGRTGGPGSFTVEHRLRRARDGAYRWFQTQAVPRRDRGEAVEWLGTSTDVDPLKALQQRESVLLDELRTRVRSSLATVRGLLRRFGDAQDGEATSFASRLGGQLDALARVQGALIRDPFGGIDLGAFLADELRAAGVREGRRAGVRGPVTLLRPRAAETVALALHELVANAVEHGALARASGRLAVAWTQDGAGGRSPRLRLDWVERTLPADVVPPARHGFGLKLLTRTLPDELDAEVALAFAPSGLTCRIDLPAACCASNEAASLRTAAG